MPGDPSTIDLRNLRHTVGLELRVRRSRWRSCHHGDRRTGLCNLYGTTGAVNCHAILGLPFGGEAQRQKWARAIRSYQKSGGSFPGACPEHATAMAIQALNLLGGDVPRNLANLAPLEPDRLGGWLGGHDWQTTHKRLWGGTVPILASDLATDGWKEELFGTLVSRLSPDRPLETWCNKNDPPWKVISKVYHVLAIFDAAAVPYPHPDLLASRLLGLDWHHVRAGEYKTLCTDGDWAWNLLELMKLQPGLADEAMSQIAGVSRERASEWNGGAISLSALTTHHIYCHLWVTALFQHADRERFKGAWLQDTLNSPHLFRLTDLDRDGS